MVVHTTQQVAGLKEYFASLHHYVYTFYPWRLLYVKKADYAGN